MTDHSSSSIRPPKDWQDFERNSRILFECFFNDIHTLNNGRAGQPQNGVDVYGRKNGKGSYIGIQCKGKDAGYGGSVTENELRNEVEKTRNFDPKITDFILITTASDDVKIQEVARKITEEREKEGNPLNVSVWGWGRLEAEIWQHDKALKSFHPDATPYSDKIIKNTEYIKDSTDNHTNMLSQLVEKVDKLQAHNIGGDNTTASMEEVDNNLHAEIDGYRDLIKEHKPKSALDFLEKLKKRVWEKASNRIKFRIITNIGSAKLDSDAFNEEAADCFLEAGTYQPDDKLALANTVLAYLLKNDAENAKEAAKSGMKKHPDSPEIASYFIQAHIKDQEITEPEKLINKDLLQTPSVYVALIFFYRSRNNPKWRDIAQEGAIKYPDEKQLIRFSSEAVLDAVLQNKYFLIGQKTEGNFNQSSLIAAAKQLQDIWNEMLKGDAPASDLGIPHNLIQMYRILGDKEAAKRVFNEVPEGFSDDDSFIKIKAAFCMDENNTEEAIKWLGKSSKDTENIFMQAEILSKNNPAAALEIINGFEEKYDISPSLRIATLCLRTDCLLKYQELSTDERIKEADKEVQSLIANYPESPLAFGMKAQVAKASGNTDAVIEALNKAKSLIKPDTDFYDRFNIAKDFEAIDKFSEVVELLDGHVNIKQDTPALRTFFFALVNSDQRKKADEILSGLPDIVTGLPNFLNAAITLHFNRGDYGAVERAIKRLLEIEPKNLGMHLNMVDMWIRRRDDKAVEKFLGKPVEDFDGRPKDFMRLAHLLDRYGFYERALNLGYKVHIENSKNPEIQLTYMGLLMKPDSSDKLNLLRKEISKDMVFSIQNTSNEKDTFIIEDDENLQLNADYIPSTHPIAQAAIGKKKSEKFNYNNCEWEVRYVRHKFLHSLDDKMNRFERLFPDNKGLQRVKIPEDKEGKKSFDEILQKIKERNDATGRILEQYIKSPLPLEIYSKYFGGDVIDLWYTLLSKRLKFKACFGSTPERSDARDCIKQNYKSGCVLDALTLHVIRRLEIEDVVTAVCGPISITESTIDVFRMRREHTITYDNTPFMSIHYDKGQFYREEVTKEQIQNTLDNINRELDWIDKNVEKVPAESDQAVSNEAAKIRDALSIDFLDPILAAQGQNRLLLCEDQSYRQFGRNEFKIRSSWLQPVLMEALEQKIIIPKRYCEVICNLIEAGHGFISIDVGILLYALREREDKFDLIVKALFGSDAEFASHFKVAVVFLSKIWSKGHASLSEQKTTSELLRRIFYGEWRSNFGDVSNVEVIGVINESSPSQAFDEYLKGWLRGHFLTS